MLWVWLAVALACLIGLGVVVWVSSGPRYQSVSRGGRPTYDTGTEQDALARVAPSLGVPGNASRGHK